MKGLKWAAVFMSFVFMSVIQSNIVYARNILSADRPSYLLPFYYIPNLSKHIKNTDQLIQQEYRPLKARKTVEAYDNVIKNPADFKPYEVAFQLNGKLLLYDMKNIYWYAHYTQRSYWQFYADSAFFRATDYKPGLFIEIPFNVGSDYRSHSSIRLGIIHQSNGLGIPNERSWNRIYGSCKINLSHAFILIKLWHLIGEKSIARYNKNISQYLGYGKLELTYQFAHRHHMQLTAALCNKTGLHIQYLIPATPIFQYILQGFVGYGNNIMFYNEYTYSISLGIAVSNALHSNFHNY